MRFTPAEQIVLAELLKVTEEGIRGAPIEVWLPYSAAVWRVARRAYANRYGDNGEKPMLNRQMIHVHTSTILSDWLLDRLEGKINAYGESIEPQPP